MSVKKRLLRIWGGFITTGKTLLIIFFPKSPVCARRPSLAPPVPIYVMRKHLSKVMRKWRKEIKPQGAWRLSWWVNLCYFNLRIMNPLVLFYIALIMTLLWKIEICELRIEWLTNFSDRCVPNCNGNKVVQWNHYQS